MIEVSFEIQNPAYRPALFLIYGSFSAVGQKELAFDPYFPRYLLTKINYSNTFETSRLELLKNYKTEIVNKKNKKLGLPFHTEQNQGMVHYTVEAILKGLKNSDNEILRFVYRKYYPGIRFFVIRNSGTEEDAKDVFQEALIVIYKKLLDNNLDLKCAFKTYLYSVCRIIWLKQLDRKKVRTDQLQEDQAFIDIESGTAQLAYEQERFRLYQKHYLTLHKDCQLVLKLFLEKVSLKEITTRLNYKSEKYTKKRKFQCKEILMKRIQNDPNFKQLQDERG